MSTGKLKLRYHLRFFKCKNPSFIRNINRPGVAIRTSTSCCKFSSWVLCRKPPVTTIDLNGTPNFDIDRQLPKTCRVTLALRNRRTLSRGWNDTIIFSFLTYMQAEETREVKFKQAPFCIFNWCKYLSASWFSNICCKQFHRAQKLILPTCK